MFVSFGPTYSLNPEKAAGRQQIPTFNKLKAGTLRSYSVSLELGLIYNPTGSVAIRI